jgi:hypothetical protein
VQVGKAHLELVLEQREVLMATMVLLAAAAEEEKVMEQVA